MYIIADCKTDGHSNMAEYKEFCGWFIISYAYINTCVCAFYLVAMDYILSICILYVIFWNVSTDIPSPKRRKCENINLESTSEGMYMHT